MAEFRLYYEVLEQAAHYVEPIVTAHEDVSPDDVSLVELTSSYGGYGRELAPIIFWKDPDVLLTAVRDGREVPLLIVEFSTAVFTEDHELQRFDGLVAAAENECPYVKVSPLSKESGAGHGGNTDFDHVTPYAMIRDAYGEYPFHVDWPVEPSGTQVRTDGTYPSCPPALPELDRLVEAVIDAAGEGTEDGWTDRLYDSLRGTDAFGAWFDAIDACELPEKGEFDSTRVFTDEVDGRERLTLKFNRFGHAMDPERGMLPYHSLVDPDIVSTMRFDEANASWYKSTTKEGEIEALIDDGLDDREAFLRAFVLGSGLYQYDGADAILDGYDGRYEVDISDFVARHYAELNKAPRTIFVFSTAFVIRDGDGGKRVKLTWDEFTQEALFADQPPATRLGERDGLSEDDVTYTVAHTVLRENGFAVESVSYPGAQGDDAVLVEPGEGRRQQRKYVDVVAHRPGEALTLAENKGKFSPRRVQRDVDELRSYRTDESYRDALETFVRKVGLEESTDELLTGVGFWANKRFELSDATGLDLDGLDYVVYLSHDGTRWNLWTNGTDAFEVTSGTVELPTTYEVVD